MSSSFLSACRRAAWMLSVLSFVIYAVPTLADGVGGGGWYGYGLWFAKKTQHPQLRDEELFASPYAACIDLAEHGAPFDIDGAGAFEFPVTTCHSSDPEITDPPVWAEFRCDDNGDLAVPPGRCVKPNSQLDPCPICSLGFPIPTLPGPIELRSGRKLESTVDYATSDNLLKVVRFYNSDIGGDAFLPQKLLRFGGIGWQFDFGPTLILNSDFYNDASLAIFTADGIEYRFYLDGVSGEFIAANDNAEQNSRFTIAFDGTLPTDLHDLNTSVSDWIVTDRDSQTSYQVSTRLLPDETVWHYGYATSIDFHGGYQWSLSYGSDAEITSIEDSFARQLTFTWLEGTAGTTAEHKILVDTIGLPDGTALKYDYAQSMKTSEAVEYSQYDHISKMQHLLDPSGSGSSNVITYAEYHYEDPNLPFYLTGITDGRGSRLGTWTYNEDGQATESVIGDDEGYEVAYSEDSEGVGHHVVTNPLGQETDYVFDWDNAYFALTKIDEQASANTPAAHTDYTYDDDLVASVTDQEGRQTTYQRNSDGLPTQIVEAAGTADERITQYAWRPDHQIDEVTAPGKTTSFTYNTNGLLTSVTETDTTTHTLPYSTNGQTRTWTYTYTAQGLLATVDGPLPGAGDTVSYSYDTHGYLATFTDELDHVTTVTSVDNNGRPLTVEDPNGIVTQLQYSPAGYLNSITVDPTGSNVVTSFEYDAVGDLTSMQKADGASFTYAYDDARRLTDITDANGSTVHLTYDDLGDLKQMQVEDAALTVLYNQSATFDELGRQLTLIGANSETWTYGYDKVSNLISTTDPRSGVQTQAFNGLNELIQQVDQANNTTDIQRDDQGQISSIEDGRDVETTYVRNGWGEPIQESSPDIGTVVYERNALGLVTKKTDARGVVAQYQYDDAGRLTAVSYPASSAENVTLSYDDATGGNLGIGYLTGFVDPSGTTAITYNSLGLIASESVTLLGVTATTEYYYDDAGNLFYIVYPSGRRISYWRDAQGEIDSVASRKTASDPLIDIATSVEWQPFGQVKSLDFANGLSLWRTFDLDYRDEQLSQFDGSNAQLQRFYGYTDDVNITNIWDTVTPSEDQSYWYSSTNQLQNASGPWGDDTFYEDEAQNLTWHITDQGTTHTEDQFTYPNDSNRLGSVVRDGSVARTFGYDDAGNIVSDVQGGVTTQYTYNDADRLASFTRGGTQRGEYTYNTRGQLVVRAVTNSSNNGTTVYFYDQQGHPIAEYDAATAALKREYVWLGDRPLAIIDPGSSGDEVYYVHSDHLNRPIAFTDASKAIVGQYTWLPFGGVYTHTGSVDVDLRFPGQMLQAESGLYNNWFRQYDPTIGRYTQPDPTGLSGSFNRYAYVSNNPLQEVDLKGLASISLPRESVPNSMLSIPGRQIRFYGPTGYAVCDVDLNHDHGAGMPHFHFWPGGIRGPGQQLIPQ